MGGVMAVEIKIIPAVIVYILYLAGLVIFAISPVLSGHSWMLASFAIALGIVAYVGHNLINWLPLSERSISLTLMDVAWGVTVTCTSAIAGFYAAQIYAG